MYKWIKISPKLHEIFTLDHTPCLSWRFILHTEDLLIVGVTLVYLFDPFKTNINYRIFSTSSFFVFVFLISENDLSLNDDLQLHFPWCYATIQLLRPHHFNHWVPEFVVTKGSYVNSLKLRQTPQRSFVWSLRLFVSPIYVGPSVSMVSLFYGESYPLLWTSPTSTVSWTWYGE